MRMMIWRFLNTGFGRGDYNMALDAALALGGFQDLPTLRVFRWRPFCISLGYHQNAGEIDLQKCEADGVDVVRRPTAGRAILHAEELTYSVAVPAAHVWYQMLPLDFYRRISEAIASGLQLLGAGIEFAPGEKLYHDGRPLRLACFASSARNEITANGKKVVGSAQRRFRAGVLQHGSILLQREHERLVKYLVGTPAEVAAERVRLQQHTTTLADILPEPTSFEEVMRALRQGFEKTLRLEFVEVEALSEEIEWAGRGSERYRIHKPNQQEKIVCTSLESC
ncbi:MAG: lipoate--protein ligase family protein [bacterium]